MAGRTRLVALETREREEAMAKLTLWGGPDDAHRRCALFAAAPHPNPFPIVRRVQRGEERARLLGQALKVAVGTAIADRPPHRSRRALLTHRAPPLGRTSAARGFETTCDPAHSRQSDRRGNSAQCPNHGRLSAVSLG